MRDKLIELLDNCMYMEGYGISLVETQADYLLANGVIVPPCKVGDTVYSYCDTFFVVLPYYVEQFVTYRIGKDNKHFFSFEASCHNDKTGELLDAIDFEYEDIGKTVFFTPEEAEQALRKEGEEK